MIAPAFAPALRRILLIQGGLLFALGLVTGLLFTFVVIGRVEIWPLLPAQGISLPGSEAGWRRAHLGLMFNAVTLLVFAAIAGWLALGPVAQRVYTLSVAITAWGNSAGFLLAAVFTGRGLALEGDLANRLTYLCFLLAALSAFVQAALLIHGAWRNQGSAAATTASR